MTKPSRHEKILMDNETQLPAEFPGENAAQRWLNKNEDELEDGAYYTIVRAFKTDRYDNEILEEE